MGRCGVKPGDVVLVHAGGSGVGSAAIQIAKLFGAEVITTASSSAKLEKAAELGADHLVNYSEADFSRAVREITGKRGADAVFEHTGEETWEGSPFPTQFAHLPHGLAVGSSRARARNSIKHPV